eukprot:7371729-Pyramimonas_sp.AAC.1
MHVLNVASAASCSYSANFGGRGRSILKCLLRGMPSSCGVRQTGVKAISDHTMLRGRPWRKAFTLCGVETMTLTNIMHCGSSMQKCIACTGARLIGMYPGVERIDSRSKLAAPRAHRKHQSSEVKPTPPSTLVPRHSEQGSGRRATPVLFEDEHYLFVNKPDGISPEVEIYAEQANRRAAEDDRQYAHLLHCLDEAVSGVVCYAKSQAAAKHYKGLSCGVTNEFLAVVQKGPPRDSGAQDSLGGCWGCYIWHRGPTWCTYGVLNGPKEPILLQYCVLLKVLTAISVTHPMRTTHLSAPEEPKLKRTLCPPHPRPRARGHIRGCHARRVPPPSSSPLGTALWALVAAVHRCVRL